VLLLKDVEIKNVKVPHHFGETALMLVDQVFAEEYIFLTSLLFGLGVTLRGRTLFGNCGLPTFTGGSVQH
jgi:hypothetical protein